MDKEGKALLKVVAEHVQATSHRRLYSTTWPADRRVGFTCDDCEQEHLLFHAWIDNAKLAPNSQVWELVGGENHARLEKWLYSIEVKDAWDHLTQDSPLEDEPC